MDADRHQALGRWSEWVGERGLARDRLLRSAGMARTALLELRRVQSVASMRGGAAAAGRRPQQAIDVD